MRNKLSMKSWYFSEDNDKLIKLVLDGKKKATSFLYNADELPAIGEESIIRFDNEKDACIVKVLDHKILKFNEMTEDLAKLEGEGDLSLKHWREVRFAFFKSLKPDFNDEDIIVFENFEVVKNLVKERLELGKMIASKNMDLFKKIDSVDEINAGFNNTLFDINGKYVIKVCTNPEQENKFVIEHNFYLSNETNHNIPKLYKYDDSKEDCEYVYEIIEKVQGQTLYYHWYKMTELQRKQTIEKIITIVKGFHRVKGKTYDWASKIKNDIKDVVEKCKNLFNENDYEMILNSFKKYDKYLSDNRFALIHNDLHFDNIIYKDGELKIIDFNDSICAPIDFEFRQFYMCQEKPWKWANSEMDPLQQPEDYTNIWKYTKMFYNELNEIKHLEERMIIYRIWNDSGHLKKYKSKELIDGIVENSRKI